jgi:hypothetical protein
MGGASTTISRREVVRLGGATALAAVLPTGWARAGAMVRIGILKFGTVSWELDIGRGNQKQRMSASACARLSSEPAARAGAVSRNRPLASPFICAIRRKVSALS